MEFADKVLPIVRNTRDILLPQWGKAEVIRRKSESPISVVTQLDHEIETFLAKNYKKCYVFKVKP